MIKLGLDLLVYSCGAAKDCLDTPPSGATSTATVNRRLLVVANRDNTFV